MGSVSIRNSGSAPGKRGLNFVAITENDADKLVLEAAVKATTGFNGYFPDQTNPTNFLLYITTPNIIALWATGFRWEVEAMQEAIEHFVIKAKNQEA